MEQFENETFVLVWTENFLYPQLFEYADVILSCDFSTWRKTIFFSVVNNSHLQIAYFQLNIALLRQHTRNNYIQAEMASITIL